MKHILPLSFLTVIIVTAICYFFVPSAGSAMADCELRHSHDVCHHEIYN